MKETLFLYGPPGAGKSTIGELLAADLNLPFFDLDEEIETRVGISIPQIFVDSGEAGFRKIERKTLNEVAAKIPAVVALGGGTLLDAGNRELVERLGVVVCLDGASEKLSERLAESERVRPLVAENQHTQLKELLAERGDHYASFQLRCRTDTLTPEEAVWEIRKLTGWFYVAGIARGYPVRVTGGGLEQLGQSLNALGVAGQVFVVTDTNVKPLHAQKVFDSLEKSDIKVSSRTIPAGERHKNLNTVTGIWDGFLAEGMDRGSCVIALGGGVVGDLAGFCAATYMRGIDWINLPTSLLAMVDASIGGKTGFDLPQGKNLIGAFHAPKLVIADPDVLSTLPEAELRGGMAEVVKHGVIGSPGLFELCSSGIPADPEKMVRLIREAVSVKVKVIQDDPYERGQRAALNYGHTIGHAVELLSGFEIRHGHAVAIGMVAEARLAEKIGLLNHTSVDRITETISRLKLPTAVPSQMDPARLLQAMQTDKKARCGEIRFSLPESIGHVKVDVVIDNLEEGLSSIREDKP